MNDFQLRLTTKDEEGYLFNGDWKDFGDSVFQNFKVMDEHPFSFIEIGGNVNRLDNSLVRSNDLRRE